LLGLATLCQIIRSHLKYGKKQSPFIRTDLPAQCVETLRESGELIRGKLVVSHRASLFDNQSDE
jgi:hypothetical protein